MPRETNDGRQCAPSRPGVAEKFEEYLVERLTPHGSVGIFAADVCFGRGHIILLEREKIKRQTIEHRRLQHRKNAA